MVLSSLILPKGFGEIADWVGPLLGPTLRPELYLVFLVLGPSLSYAPLLMTWVAAGVVGGFFARGVLRSMAAGTFSVITLELLILGNGLLLFTGIMRLMGGLSGLNFPAPPPGLSLVDILNTPMVAQAVQAATAGGGANPFAIVEVLIVNFILNIVLYAVSFNVSGFVFSKIFPGRRQGPLPALPQAEYLPKTQPATGTVITAFAILLLLVSSMVLPAGFAQGSGSFGGQSGEHLALDLQKDGSLRMVYSTNVSSLPGVPTDYQRDEFRGLVGGFLIAFNGSIDLGQGGSAGSGGPLSFLLPLLPENGFLAVYRVSDASTGRARADLLASEFGQGFGESLKSAVSLDFPSFAGQQVPGGGIYLGIYTGDSSARTVGTRVLSLVQGTGVGSILTSQKVFISQFGVLAGFVGFNFENATATPSPSVSITADLTPLGNFYGRGNFTLGLRQVLGNQGSIGPSMVARTTSIQLGFPANSTVTGHGPSSATVNSTMGQLTFSMNTTDTPVPNVYVNFTSTFPQRIEINRQLDPRPPFSSGTTVTEKITVRNLGNETIRKVVVSEKRLFQTYPTLQLLSPSQNVTVGDIPPLGSGNATLQFRVGSDGVYTLPPTDITYIDQGQTISKPGTRGYMQSSFNLQLYLGRLVSGTAPYSYLFLLLAVLPPIFQLRKLSRRPRASVEPPPVPSAAPEY